MNLNNGSIELRISLQGLMSVESGCLKRGSTEQRIRYAERTLYTVYVKEKMALVQSKRSVAHIYLIVASRTMVFDLSGNLSSP